MHCVTFNQLTAVSISTGEEPNEEDQEAHQKDNEPHSVAALVEVSWKRVTEHSWVWMKI